MGPTEVVVEACSVWPHVYDTAVSAGARVALAHPYKVRLISEASLKSDLSLTRRVDLSSGRA